MIRLRASVIANGIKMRRSQRRDSVVVVEGRDDRFFMRKFSSRESCRIVVVEGKQNVCDVIDALDRDGFVGALGIIDADFDRITGVEISSRNLLRYECHDLETMLLHSQALDSVLIEFVSLEKLKEELENLQQNVLEELISKALPLAYLRLHSLLNGLNLRFDGMRYTAWIDRSSFEANTDRMIREVRNRSQRHDLRPEDLYAAMEEIERSNFDPREMCNGADLVEILSVGLRGALGANQRSSVTGEVLRRSLRLAYSDQNFIESNLYAEIKAWEARVAVFRILRL